MEKKRKLIGDKAFYAMVLAIAVPIAVQNGVTNFVNLLDNIMVGRIGTEQMSGVSIVNQLLFVYNLSIFGALSGAGIFTAQYFGKGDPEGIRNTFRIKLFIGSAITVLAIILFSTHGDALISLYLNEGSEGDLEATLSYAHAYLNTVLFNMPAFMILQVYSSTLRETGETLVPMRAGLCAVCVNLVFNYFLIYGKCGFPVLGVVGAGIATDISRYVEAAAVVVWMHRHKEKVSYITGVYRTLRVPKSVVSRVAVTATPLLFNEVLYSIGEAFLVQCYSYRGLATVAAFNISNTLNNLFIVVFLALGNAVGIIVGRLLGAGKLDEAIDTDRKLIAFSTTVSVAIGLVMMVFSPFFPKVYNTTSEVRKLATRLIIICSAAMPVRAFVNATYFTLRSGGKTLITFLFDSAFVWVVNVPIAFSLSRFTSIPSDMVFLCVMASDIIKIVIGAILVKKRVWLRNIVNN